MNVRLIRAGAIAAALTALCSSAPAFADGHAHGNGGGAAFARGHGGYTMGPRPGAHIGVAPGRNMGFAGPRTVMPSRGGFVRSPDARNGFSPNRIYGGSSPNRTYGTPRFRSAPSFRAPDRAFSSRLGPTRPVRGVMFSGRPRSWAGGSFRGRFWPRSFWRPGFVRFVTVLPAFYSTFWFAGVPYYYWDYTYYTWSPLERGYVATNPPPAVDDDSSDSGSADVQSSDSLNLYVYPKNGQSDEQTSKDRYECHQWAAGQTGFDPTNGANQSAGSAGPADYRRAMMACLDARGYSVR